MPNLFYSFPHIVNILIVSVSGLDCTYILYIATLNVYHGRIYTYFVLVDRVEDITVLSLNGDELVYHFFDCNSTTTSPVNLVWERGDGENQRFPTSISSGAVLRLDMAPTTGKDLRPVMSSDLGVYVCRDVTTNETLSLKIFGGTVTKRILAV